jgi:acetyltransferase-like isoleucine patch superfamily enzyme
MLTVPHTHAEIEALIDRALERPGLLPFRSAALERTLVIPPKYARKRNRLLADGPHLARIAPKRWPDGAIELFRLGLVHLRDAHSFVSEAADLSAKRLILRRSIVEAFTSFVGDGVLVEESFIGSHSRIEGPVTVVGSNLFSHVALGPLAILVDSGMGQFTKAQRHVRVEKSAIGAGTVIEGGTHPEKLPLGPSRRSVGVTIGPDCWVGQHVSISAGAVIPAGVSVAPHTSITRPIPEHVLVKGVPLRVHPIDANVRGLTAEEALAEGAAQGFAASLLPVYGPCRAAFRNPRVLEIDYADHGYLRGLASASLLHFQRGALRAAMAGLFADRRVDVDFAVGSTVRFVVHFDRRVDPNIRRRDGLGRLWRSLGATGAEPLPALEAASPRSELAADPRRAPPSDA